MSLAPGASLRCGRRPFSDATPPYVQFARNEASAFVFPEAPMTIDRRFLLIAISLAFSIPVGAAQAAEKATWNGTWVGLLGNMSPIAVTIANDKVVSYTIRGAPFDVQYSNVTPTKVSFGDRDHYSMQLVRTGDSTAAARFTADLATGRLRSPGNRSSPCGGAPAPRCRPVVDLSLSSWERAGICEKSSKLQHDLWGSRNGPASFAE